jgi:tRNA uridine 5-carbamoylmethylation protein Kti12
VIVLDDNFYLQSMRKQVYQAVQDIVDEYCSNDGRILQPLQRQKEGDPTINDNDNNNKDGSKPRPSTSAAAPTTTETNQPPPCHFFVATVHVDTPLATCLERNRLRTNPVPDNVIERMHQRMESPQVNNNNNSNKKDNANANNNNNGWEQCVLKIDNNNSNGIGTKTMEKNVQQLQNFVKKQIAAALSNDDDNNNDKNSATAHLQPRPDPFFEQARLLQERQATFESTCHQADNWLRQQAVATVASIQPSVARHANLVRKQVLQQFQQQRQKQQQGLVPRQDSSQDEFAENRTFWKDALRSSFIRGMRQLMETLRDSQEHKESSGSHERTVKSATTTTTTITKQSGDGRKHLAAFNWTSVDQDRVESLLMDK